MRKTVIPFGPQHPVLPEPIHLKLTIEDERITEAVPALGYVHRGLERLADVRDFHQMIQVVERVCGICSMIHAACYCQGVEEIMGIEVPPGRSICGSCGPSCTGSRAIYCGWGSSPTASASRASSCSSGASASASWTSARRPRATG